jgi:xanthine dehydrogenase molybdopterin binding subunit
MKIGSWQFVAPKFMDIIINMQNQPLPHDSAIKHVSGESVYVDDILTDERLLTGRVVYSTQSHAKLTSVDISAALSIEGVVSVLTHQDIPGENQMGPVIKDEICLASDEVTFVGQAICLIAAQNEEICIQAEKVIKIKYDPLPACLTIEEAQKKKNLLGGKTQINRGNVEKALALSDHKIEGELSTGAQEHWYLETQVCLCQPGEDVDIIVYSSTQHPSETQALIAAVLGIQRKDVVVEVRRMGGAFGGKETQANHTACWAALLCQATGKPVKIRLSRDDDQKMTGKRHPFLIKYQIGFNASGLIMAARFDLHSNGGAAMDLSHAIMERAMFHVDNAYFIPNLNVTGREWRTNLPPNTALRGFGAPQAIAAIENVIDRIARFLKKDPAGIRQKNFYGIKSNNITHYGQKVEHNHLSLLYKKLYHSSEYQQRRGNINQFNAQSEFIKKGMALTPVKFGIAFTTSFLNQAGALVNIYHDGTVLINHGGTEMGQGLHTKIARIASEELGVDPRYIKVNATDTSKVPNTSATAASSGTDLNGMAVKNAIEKLKKRIFPVALDLINKRQTVSKVRLSDLLFEHNYIVIRDNPKGKIPFKDVVATAYLQQTSLSATGYYSTPLVHWDKKRGKGRPFNYYAFGMAVSEVQLDILTGYHKIIRTDILHDVGDSINFGIDMGQIQGGFIQGVGWCTTEECKWDDHGNLLNHSPDTYKIPVVGDIPEDFRVEILSGYPNPQAIAKNKAVGEPPLMLSISVWLAIKDAISAFANHEIEPEFTLPATNEVILLSIENLKKKSS